MFLNDHETDVDLLYYEAIARTVVKLIRRTPNSPVTIGVHGDWGMKAVSGSGYRKMRFARIAGNVAVAVFFFGISTHSLRAAELAPQPQHIHFKLQSNLPTVEAKISGQSVSLFLDLGAYQSLALTTRALNSTPVEFTGQTETYRDSAGQTLTSRVFKVTELVADEFTAKGIEGVEFSLSKGTGNFAQDGYIGFGLLMHYFLVFDYVRSELRLYPPGTSELSLRGECGGGKGFRIEVQNGVVQTKVETEKGAFVFHLDTGSRENVLRPSAVGLPIDTKQSSFAFPKFNIGKHKLGRSRFSLREFAAPDVDGVLGTDFFGSKVVCFDFVSQTAWIK